MTATTDYSAAGLYSYAEERNQLPLLQKLVPPFLSPNPLASFEWLASVEQDPELRKAYEMAAELLRARHGGDQ